MEFYVQKDSQQYWPLTGTALPQNQADSSTNTERALSFLRNVGLSAIVLVIASCGESTPDAQKRADNETARVVAEADALAEGLKAERQQAQKDYEDAKRQKAEGAQKEADLKQAQDAEEDHKRRMRKLDQEIAAEESKAKRLKEQQERDEKLRQEKLAKAKEKEAKEKAIAAKTAVEQVERQRVAEQMFRSINLEPQVTFSPALVAIGAKVEARGEALETLKDLYRKGDWLGVHNFVDRSSATLLPEPELIRHAARDIGQIEISLFLKTPYQKTDDRELMMYAIRRYSPGNFMSTAMIANTTKRHPDGTGYIFPWKFDHHHVFFFLADNESSSQLRKFERDHEKEVKQLETRRKLTEISKHEFDASVERLDSDLPKKIAQWVLGGAAH